MIRRHVRNALARGWTWFAAGFAEHPTTGEDDASYRWSLLWFRWGLTAAYVIISLVISPGQQHLEWVFATIGYLVVYHLVGHTVHTVVHMRRGRPVTWFWEGTPFFDIVAVSLIMASVHSLAFPVWSAYLLVIFGASVSRRGSYVLTLTVACIVGYSAVVAIHVPAGRDISWGDAITVAILLVFGGWFSNTRAGLERVLFEDLREGEERYRTLVETSPDAITLTDLEGKVLVCNEQAAMLHGFESCEDMLGREALELIAPEDRQRAVENMGRTLAVGSVRNVEYTLIRRDGRRFPAELSASLVVDAEGKPKAFIGVVRDIAERKQAEAALRESEERFRQLSGATLDGIVIHVRGRVVEINEQFTDIFGRQRSEIVGAPVMDLVAPQSRDLVSQYIKSNREEPYEALAIRKDGTVFPVEVSGKSITYYGSDARVAAIRDITERKQAEAALRESETKFRTLADTVGAATFIFQGTRMCYVNSGAETLTGYSRQELLTMSFWDVIHPDLREMVRERGLARQRGEDVPTRYEVKLLTKNGEERWLDVTMALIEFEGKPAALGTAFDITERKQAEDALRESEEKYRDLVENMSEVLYALDRDGRITYVSPVVEQLGGYSPSEIIGRSFTEFIHPDDLLPLVESFRRTISGNLEPSEYRVFTKSGDVRWVRTSSRPVFEDDRMTGLRAVMMDITDRKQAEEAVRESEELHRSLVETSPDAVIRTDLDGTILMANRRAAELLGFENAEEVIGENALEFIDSEDRQRVKDDIRKTEKAGIMRNIEHTLLRRDGTRIPAELSASAVVDAEGKARAYICVVRDISERKEAEEIIKHLAYHDALTDLPNRALFEDRLTVALAQARRKGHLAAVMFLDLDRFKVVNDTVGHALGDELLRSVARRLTSLVREGDTVARVGGDEFTLLFPEIGGVEEAAEIADRILETFRQPWALDSHEFHVTTSIGIAMCPNDGEDADSLLRNADTAMYRAKDQGRDNCQLYTPTMNARIAERVALESSLRRGLEREEFLVYYQPQVDIHSGRIVGVEALVRWQHSERGLVLPAEFIPMAEETGLIVPLGEWVLRTACAQNSAWQKAGHPPMRVAVNLSARQFQQRDLIATVARVLEETGLDPKSLQLEITEGAAMEDAEFTITMLRELREMGVGIAIDDFGTGHSSLSYLKRFPIDVVKIDRSFVRDLTVDPSDAAIATTIITMAHNLKLRVIAEGVETEEQLAFLKRKQCDEMQGFLFSKPVPSEALEKVLATNKRRARARLVVDSV